MRISPSLASAALVAGALAIASPAAASRYYSARHPLQAMEDGAAQAQMHGRFFKEQLSYLRNNTHVRDPRPGGDSVYEQTNYAWFFAHAIGPDYWYGGGEDQSPRTDSGSWYFQYDHEAFPGSASRGRMRAKVCEDQRWSFDPCSVGVTDVFHI